jgi:hypothetical protein
MTAMMIDDGKRVAAGRARLQWHMIPIADIDLIARNTYRFAYVEALNGATGTSDPAAAGPRGSGEGDGNRPNTIVKALNRFAFVELRRDK